VLEQCAIDGEVFDEDMGLWASDADLAWRARLLGWRCAYTPDATARHIRTYSPSTRDRVAEAHRRLQFRNRYVMWAKNETRPGLLRDLPRVAAYEAAQLAWVLLRERYLLGGYREAWRAMPGARRRRDGVQARRAVERPPFGLSPRP
jgi:GT2 family glycosyltransferase